MLVNITKYCKLISFWYSYPVSIIWHLRHFNNLSVWELYTIGSMSANRTAAAYFRSNKLTRSLKKKQKALQVVGHKIVHDEPTRCFQHGGQVLWATLSSLCTPGGELQILSTNAQKTQTSPTLKQWGMIYLLWMSLQMLWSNSVLPLLWKICSCLEVPGTTLTCDMKRQIRDDIKRTYEDPRQNLQNCAQNSNISWSKV